MWSSEPSRTSIGTALRRGQHRLGHERPWVLDDPFALLLIGPAWTDMAMALQAAGSAELHRQQIAGIVARSRWAEDRAVLGGFDQFVILGAGLDTFAWRRPDVLGRMTVFEVDHPSTQNWKLERAQLLGLPTNERHRFVSCDFETTSLATALQSEGFDTSRRTCFSWLGVVAYLSSAAIDATLAFVRDCPGSEIALTYPPAEDELDEVGAELRRLVLRVAAAGGEPVLTILTPGAAEELGRRHGLRVIDHPTRDNMTSRYFADRRDALRPHTNERCIAFGAQPATPASEQ